jgi:catechol O-methyltransferase
MNVGELKGKIVTDLIRETKPQMMIELGGYCGYSTILFGAAVRATGGKKYYSLERSGKFAKNIEVLVELAGLKDFVQVLVGPSNEGIRTLHSRRLETIDMMFLDHYKPAYTSDLKLCEHLSLIKKGTVPAADNVISPGNPPYLEYVRSSVEEKRLKLTRKAKADTESFRVGMLLSMERLKNSAQKRRGIRILFMKVALFTALSQQVNWLVTTSISGKSTY